MLPSKIQLMLDGFSRIRSKGKKLLHYIILYIFQESFRIFTVFRGLIVNENYLRIKQNYLELTLNFNDSRTEFAGKGVHLGSGKEFGIVEGELNKKTKYWKFIATYEGGIKKSMARKELIQV